MLITADRVWVSVILFEYNSNSSSVYSGMYARADLFSFVYTYVYRT